MHELVPFVFKQNTHMKTCRTQPQYATVTPAAADGVYAISSHVGYVVINVIVPFLFVFKGQLINNHGHRAYSRHTVLTEDGYLINLFNVIEGRGDPPFLLLHALMGASDQWFLRDQHHDLRKYCGWCNFGRHCIVNACDVGLSSHTFPVSIQDLPRASRDRPWTRQSPSSDHP